MTTAPALAPAADHRLLAPERDTLKPLNEVCEVAAYLRCGRTHVFELIRHGQLASVKVGRKRLIPHDAVVEYVAGLTAKRAG